MNTYLTRSIEAAGLQLRSGPLRTAKALKRSLDLLFAFVGLIFTAPVMLVAALLLRLEAPGNVIFAQERVGQHGRRFTLYKFRKFRPDWGDHGPSVTVANDARLTKLGAFLERTKIDELPQLWNIKKGDMSFVGPRPEPARCADLFAGRYAALLEIMPGLFGPSSGRECDLYPPDEDPDEYYRRVLFPKKAERNLAYYAAATPLSDFMWVVKGLWESTIGAVDWKRLMRSHGVVIAIDFVLVELGWTLSNLFRFSGLPQGPSDHAMFIAGLWIFPVCVLISSAAGRCYRYPKKHFSLVDAVRLTIVLTIGWTAGFLTLAALNHYVSLYLAPMGWFVLLTLVMFGRIGFRFAAHAPSLGAKPTKLPRILIYGSTECGIALADWIRNSANRSALLGFLDDNPEHRSQRVRGVPIVGSERDLPSLSRMHQIGEIWLMFKPEESKRHRLSVFCDQHGIKLIVFPELEPFTEVAAAA